MKFWFTTDYFNIRNEIAMTEMPKIEYGFNHLFDFLDNLESHVHKHMVMLYEEPEYARLVQIRFLNDGLKKGECCVYATSDHDSLNLTKTDMVQNGIDVDNYMNKGLLQFHLRNPSISDSGSYEVAIKAFQETIGSTYFSAPQHSTEKFPKIRGVGSVNPYVFAHKNVDSEGPEAASQLMVERLFQSQSLDSFEGVWMCTFQVDNILGSMNEEWMKAILRSHDAVLFLRKLSDGIALDIRK
jgi:hypothetical protein